MKMKMNKYLTGVIAVAATVALSGLGNDAEASTASAAWSTQSNPTCSNIYGSTAVETRISKKDLVVGENTATLPDGSIITLVVPEGFTAVTSWQQTDPGGGAVTPIVNSVILRSNEASVVYAYSVETTSDSDLSGPPNGFSTISVCTGIDFQASSPSAPLPNCNTTDFPEFDFDAVCKPGSKDTVVTLYQSQYGQYDDSGNPLPPKFAQCVCLNEVSACSLDPSANSENKCFDKNNADNEPLLAAPISVEYLEDYTYVCTTIGGTRRCYKF